MKRRYLFLFSTRTIVLAGFAVLASGCSKQEQEQEAGSDQTVLAEIDGQPVTEEMFRHWWAKRPPTRDDAAIRHELLDQLIERTALAEAARRSGLAEDPIVLEQIQSLLIGRLQEIQLAPKLAEVTASEEEIRTYYEDHKEDLFTRAKRLRVAVLWFDTLGQQPLVDRYTPRLEKIRSRLSNDPVSIPLPEGFGKLAVQNSEHRTSRYKGGRLGWITKDRAMDSFHAAVNEIAAALHEPGEVSSVVSRPEGLFLVRLLDREEARPAEFAAVRDKIRDDLLRGRRAELEEQFRVDLLQSFPVEHFPEHLVALENLPVSAPRQPRFAPVLSQHQDR